MCYSEFGEIFHDIAALDADVLLIEHARSDAALLRVANLVRTAQSSLTTAVVVISAVCAVLSLATALAVLVYFERVPATQSGVEAEAVAA